jgi:hypothetical protein
MGKPLELLSERTAALAPGWTPHGWSRHAYEAVKSQVAPGEDPENLMVEYLHEKASRLQERRQGVEALQAGVRNFRAKPVVSPEVLAVNRRRVREAGGLTDELKQELGMKTAAERKQDDKRQAREDNARRSARNGSDRDGEEH